jgi:predicted glycoside hydrolase/deacetylase ChbG (UPF0249 family)
VKSLVVNADDFGMCHAVNEAIVGGFLAGAITQASLMACGAAVGEAVAAARQYRIPCAAHLTLASDWDRVRWRPKSGAFGLTTVDGYFPPHVRDLRGCATDDAVEREFIAQIESIKHAGISIVQIDSHIMPWGRTVLLRLAERYHVICRDIIEYYGDAWRHSQATLFHLSTAAETSEEKWCALRRHLEAMGQGIHFVVCHPAVQGRDLDGMCSDAWPGRKRWAGAIRFSDLDCLMNADIVSWASLNGFRLSSIDQIPLVRD